MSAREIGLLLLLAWICSPIPIFGALCAWLAAEHLRERLRQLREPPEWLAAVEESERHYG